MLWVRRRVSMRSVPGKDFNLNRRGTGGAGEIVVT